MNAFAASAQMTPARSSSSTIPRRLLTTVESAVMTPPPVPPRPGGVAEMDPDATLPYTGPTVGLNSSGRVTFKI